MSFFFEELGLEFAVLCLKLLVLELQLSLLVKVVLVRAEDGSHALERVC